MKLPACTALIAEDEILLKPEPSWMGLVNTTSEWPKFLFSAVIKKQHPYAELIELIKKLYNKAWEKNWGFVPMTDAEIRFMAHELKVAVMKDPEQVIFVEPVEPSSP